MTKATSRIEELRLPGENKADFTVEHEPEVESEEDDAAGLRRAICETCEKAGL